RTDAGGGKLGMTNTSLFACVAAGVNGLRVVQLTSPAETPTYLRFSPRPAPRLIATKPPRGAALAVSKGTDRDRAVDESGHQIAVFTRIGSRPLTRPATQRQYPRDGREHTGSDEAPTEPRGPAAPRREESAPSAPEGPRLRRPR